MRIALALLAATALSSPAWSADDPAMLKGANDTRIRGVDYNERSVTRITSTDLVPITLTYGEFEKPMLIAGVNVAVVTPPDHADAKAAQAAAEGCTNWCADRHANELTLQPLKPDTGSMLAVTTEKEEDGKVIRHHYNYELNTRTGTPGADPKAYFRVLYWYSAEDAAKAAAAWRLAHAGDIATAAHQKVMDRLATSQFSAPRNFRWKFNNSVDCRTIGPERISDNGRDTVVHFRMNSSLAIPNIVGEDDQESLAQFNNDVAAELWRPNDRARRPGTSGPEQAGDGLAAR